MISLPTVLPKFALVGIMSCIDLLIIFRYEAMHALALGRSGMIKQCNINIIGTTYERLVYS